MSRYRKTFKEAMEEVQLNEVGYLQSKLNDRQIQNIKKIWQFKTKKDVTPAVIKMIKNMDPITQGAIKDAGINLLSDIAEGVITEGRMSEIDAMQKAGKSAAEIAKVMKLPVKTVKAILGEQETDSAQDMQDVKPGKDKIKEDEDKDLEEFIDDVKNNTPNSEQFDEDKKKKKDDVAPDNDVPVEVKEQEDQSKEVDKLKKELEKSREQNVAIKQKADLDKSKNVQKATDKMVNPETGEPLLQVGIAYKHLKAKMEKEKEEQESKKRSDMIAKMGKDKPKLNDEEEEMTESAASDKAKGMGLDYMKFGRYGKDGKVTHKTSGDNLVKVGKDDEPQSDTPAPKKPEAPKKDKPKEADDKQIKSRNFLKDLDNGDLEDEDGNPIELDFDDEFSFDAAIEKCREMGLDDVASDLEDVGSDVAEAEPDKAEAAFQDVMAKYSGKKLASLEKMKVADKQIGLFNDQAYGDMPQQTSKNMGPLIKDGTATLKTLVDMVNADKTEGNPGSGTSNPKKGFRPEIIDTLQSLEDMATSLLNVADETKDEKMKEKLEMIAGELEFCYDENADHDNYTKSHKCNSSLEAALDMFKDLSKMTSKNESFELTEANLSKQQIDILKKEYEPLRGKRISAARAQQLMNILNKFKDSDLKTLSKANIPFLSSGSKSKLAVRGMKFTVKNINPFGESTNGLDEEAFNEACWKGYKQVGFKKKGGKQVPNCVPEEIEEGRFTKIHNLLIQKGRMQQANDKQGEKRTDIEIAKQKKMLGINEVLNKDDEKAIKPVIKQLKKSVSAHDKQAKSLEKAIKEVKFDFIKLRNGTKVLDKVYPNMTQARQAASGLMQLHRGTKADGYQSPFNNRFYVRIREENDSAFEVSGQENEGREELKEMKKDDAYAIGMAQAKKVMNDEPPLEKKTIKKGHEIADKILNKKENAPSEADIERLKKQGMKPKKEQKEHPAAAVYEQIKGLKNKAEKSGMPYSILKKVYDRGMAAWRGGHRPGTTQQQWAFARVNSFVTKSSGTWGGADKDLAKQVKGK